MSAYKAIRVQQDCIWHWTVRKTYSDGLVAVRTFFKTEADAQMEAERLTALEVCGR